MKRDFDLSSIIGKKYGIELVICDESGIRRDVKFGTDIFHYEMKDISECKLTLDEEAKRINFTRKLRGQLVTKTLFDEYPFESYRFIDGEDGQFSIILYIGSDPKGEPIYFKLRVYKLSYPANIKTFDDLAIIVNHYPASIWCEDIIDLIITGKIYYPVRKNNKPTDEGIIELDKGEPCCDKEAKELLKHRCDWEDENYDLYCIESNADYLSFKYNGVYYIAEYIDDPDSGREFNEDDLASIVFDVDLNDNLT